MTPRPISRALLPLLVGATLSLSALAADLNSDRARYSYTLGYQVADRLKSQGMDVDPAAFAEAVQDVLSGRKAKLSLEQMDKALGQAQAEMVKRKQQQAENNAKAGEAFRSAFSKKGGVKSLDNGLQYRVIKAGSGPTPAEDATVMVHYRGTHIDGTEFDSSLSRKEPATFPLEGVIPGFSAALRKMAVGSKWEVVIPSDQAYGIRGASPRIGPEETLVFEIELLGIK
jgi:FKBP-type peptidyl-prolyl cis-trans isomerase FklB